MPTGVYQHKKGYKRKLFSKKWKKRLSKGNKKRYIKYPYLKKQIAEKLVGKKKFTNSKKGRIKIIKKEDTKMDIKKFLYGTKTKRIIMRFIEIFAISGLISVLNSPELSSLLPPVYIGFIAMAVKALRGLSDKVEFENTHVEVPDIEDIKNETR